MRRESKEKFTEKRTEKEPHDNALERICQSFFVVVVASSRKPIFGCHSFFFIIILVVLFNYLFDICNISVLAYFLCPTSL